MVAAEPLPDLVAQLRQAWRVSGLTLGELAEMCTRDGWAIGETALSKKLTGKLRTSTVQAQKLARALKTRIAFE